MLMSSRTDDGTRLLAASAGSTAADQREVAVFELDSGASPRPPAQCSSQCPAILPGPSCVKNIIGNELCERFCYYGLRAVLVLFFVEELGWAESSSITLFSLTSAAAYFTPLLGGLVADTWLGKYKTILYFSFVYLVGTALLSLGAFASLAGVAVLGLGLISLGTGGIKPCVSAFGADQFSLSSESAPTDSVETTALTRYFLVFYFSINVGSVLSFLVTPLVRTSAGYGWAFLLPTLLLGAALAMFFAARKRYRRIPPSGSPFLRFVRVALAARRRRGPTREHHYATLTRSSWLERARGEQGISEEDVDDAVVLWRLVPVLAVMPMFWALFDMQGSAWTLQAKAMNLGPLQPEQLGVLNPLFVMVLIPCFDRGLYPCSCGSTLTAASFVISALLQVKIESAPPNTVSVGWQVPQIFLITVSEILVSVTGLEFSYEHAPVRSKALVSALWLLTTSFGDLLTGVLFSAMGDLRRSLMLGVFAGLMVVNCLAFCFVARWFRRGTASSDALMVVSAAIEQDEDRGKGGSEEDDDDVVVEV